MITSKGEPTIFPEQVTRFLEELEPFKFPISELQTNGLLIADGRVTDAHLQKWYDLGLTTIAISVVHYEGSKNKSIYTPHREYQDLPALIAKLKKFNFTVRLATVLVKGYLDSVDEMKKMIDFATANGVDQLTFRPVTKPDKSENESIYKWTAAHAIDDQLLVDCNAYLKENGSELLELAHGATVYDVNGQNVCMTNCLTIQPKSEEMRQIIFYPDGSVRYAWQFSGARLF
jgi:molybdenum cofactor biosynthesis enzyme MoaA